MKQIPVLPCGKRVLLQPIKEDSILETSEESQEKPVKGRILSIGDEVDITKFAEGDIVYYRYFMCHPIVLGEVEYFILEASEVLGKEV